MSDGDSTPEEIAALRNLGPLDQWGVTLHGIMLDGVGPTDLTQVEAPDWSTLPPDWDKPKTRKEAARRGARQFGQ